MGFGVNGIGRNEFWPKWPDWPKRLLAKLGIGPSGVGRNGIGRKGFGRSGNSPTSVRSVSVKIFTDGHLPIQLTCYLPPSPGKPWLPTED